MKSILLIDGEHYPPVVARAVAGLRERGEDPVLALLVGGSEKLGQSDVDIGVPVETPEDPEAGLAEALVRTGAGQVVDLSDEPVLGYVRRMRMASIAVWRGAAYRGADFLIEAPERQGPLPVPSVGIIGTGKRTGKTAIGGAVARRLAEEKMNPVVVAMGRGGPAEPEVIDAADALDAKVLLEWAESGRHAASDYIEDALMARVPTVGAWRAGGGLAGAPFFGNYDRALEKAAGLDPGILVLEGSGSAIPPARFDAGILIVDAGIDPGHLCGYMGLYRLLLADLIVLTMCEETLDPRHLAAVEDCIRSRPAGDPKTARTVFRPHPLSDVSGKRVWMATTAPTATGKLLTTHMQEAHGAEVIGISHALADRPALKRDLEGAAGADAIVVELKAAAVDVVTRFGLENGIEVVFMDNRALTPEGDPPLDDMFAEVGRLAFERFEA